MAKKKSSDKLDQNLKKAASSIGKAIARSQARLEKTKRQAFKKAEEVVDKVTQTAKNTQQNNSKATTPRRGPSSRFKASGRKSVTDSIGVLAEEIRVYLEENEAIGLSRLVNVMKSRGNSEAMSYGAIGWLARDGKVSISRDGKKISIK